MTTDEVDPFGPATGTGCGTYKLGVQKMAKGSSWHTDVANHMRISHHYKWVPAVVHPELGFGVWPPRMDLRSASIIRSWSSRSK